MSRLTIKLDDELHRALKEMATRERRSMSSIIEESLRLRGIQKPNIAQTLVAQARGRAQLDPAVALKLAVEEALADRKR